MSTIFSVDKIDFTKEKMFFGADPNIARYDVQKYSIFEKLTDKQHGFFWRPTEVDLTKDSRDWKGMNENKKFIFTSNLKYQILLDSVQGRAVSIAFSPFITIPELEVCVNSWSFFETIHSRSYTHIIRNIYSDPSEVFDVILDDEMILERAYAITKQYDAFIEYGHWFKLLGEGNFTIIDNSTGKEKKLVLSSRVLKEKLYETLSSVYILEGIRFYVSFACSFAFAECDEMEGSAKIISLIARDESEHLAITKNIIKALPIDDPEYADIIHSKEKDVMAMFVDGVDTEKRWASYLFKSGSMLGLNETLLSNYVEYIANKRLRSFGLKPIYTQHTNPLGWTNKYLQSKARQNAAQETELDSYVVGAVNTQLHDNSFNGFTL